MKDMAGLGGASLAGALLLTLAGCGGPSPTAGPAASPNAASPAAENVASAPAPAAPAPAALALRPEGYDTIRIGAPPAAAQGYALADDGNYDDVCRIYASPRLPGVYAIVENGRVMRLTADAAPDAPPPAMRTDRGIGVGSTEAEVRAAYAPLREQPHHYVEAPAKDLFFGGSESEPGLRFEIGADGRVTAVHAGLMPVLAYVEACS